MRAGCRIERSINSRSLMTGNVRTEESRKETRRSPGPPRADAKKMILFFQVLSHENKRDSSVPKKHFESIKECSSEKSLRCFGNDVVHVMQFVRRNHVRRQDIDNVAKRAQQHAPVQKKPVKLRSHRGKIAGIFGAQLNCADRSNLPRLADYSKILELLQPLAGDFGNSCDAIEDGFVLENLQTGIRRCAGQSVSGVGMSVIERMHPVFVLKRGLNAVRAQRDAHRQKA